MRIDSNLRWELVMRLHGPHLHRMFPGFDAFDMAVMAVGIAALFALSFVL
jgi:hypothetical protein